MTLRKLLGAIALSIFVIPGAGHALFKKKLRGMIYTGFVLGVLAVLFVHILIIATDLIAQRPPATSPGEILAASQSMTEEIMSKSMSAMQTYMMLLCLGYLGSVVDLIYLYKKTNSPFQKWIEEQKQLAERQKGASHENQGGLPF